MEPSSGFYRVVRSFYKVGDFKQVDGKWTFVPDAEFEQADQSMNFGKDSYAAMTYYVQALKVLLKIPTPRTC